MSRILEVTDLHVRLSNPRLEKEIIKGITFTVESGMCLGILGESGSGKSIANKGILGLLDKNFTTSGTAIFKGRDLLNLSKEELRKIRGKEIAMVLQNPMTCFDPLYKIGDQISETFRTHRNLDKSQILEQSIELLEKMQLFEAKEVLNKYPHQLSGGMLQRIMIGIALSLEPALIIADEPTTAIDAINQYEIMKTFVEIKKETQTAMIFISHDLGVMSKIADDIIVMNQGIIVDRGDFHQIVKSAKDPYTQSMVEKKMALSRAFGQVLDRKRVVAV